MEAVSLQFLTLETKVRLLRALGYDSDGAWVLDAARRAVKDRYTGDPVSIDRMVIVPGSTIILDNNPLSLASYFEEFGEV